MDVLKQPGQDPITSPIFAQAHMWDMEQPLDEDLIGRSEDNPYLYDSNRRLGACGDFCSASGGVLGAAASGAALGERVIAEIQSR